MDGKREIASTLTTNLMRVCVCVSLCAHVSLCVRVSL